MKQFFKILFYVLIVALVLMQFYPKPKKNFSATIGPNDITVVHQVPGDVLQVLKTSCYDCHSNNSIYPWYSKIQPVAWWMGGHIEEGKRELNFSEFGTYSLRRKYKKLQEINEQVKEGEMPLSSYTLIHRDAILDNNSKLLISTWVTALRDSFKANYPIDSLERKKK